MDYKNKVGLINPGEIDRITKTKRYFDPLNFWESCHQPFCTKKLKKNSGKIFSFSRIWNQNRDWDWAAKQRDKHVPDSLENLEKCEVCREKLKLSLFQLKVKDPVINFIKSKKLCSVYFIDRPKVDTNSDLKKFLKLKKQ